MATTRPGCPSEVLLFAIAVMIYVLSAGDIQIGGIPRPFQKEVLLRTRA